MNKSSKNLSDRKKENRNPTKTDIKRDILLFEKQISSYELDDNQTKVLNDIKLKLQELLYNLESEEIQITIPITIFSTRHLGVLEILVKYLKEESNLSIKQIAKLLDKNYSTTWNTYNKATTKHQERLSYDSSGTKIPINIFSEKLLGPLEALVVFLKEKLMMKNSEIAKLLQKSPKTIWSSYNKAKQKYNG